MLIRFLKAAIVAAFLDRAIRGDNRTPTAGLRKALGWLTLPGRISMMVAILLGLGARSKAARKGTTPLILAFMLAFLRALEGRLAKNHSGKENSVIDLDDYRVVDER
jgi:kynureninase